MKEEYEYGYPDDRELEELIADVERSGMIVPPPYMKELILGELRKEAEVSNKERRAKIQFLVYSTKIVAAAAAAVFCLTIVPADMGGGMTVAANQRMEKRIEKDVERYRQEKEQLLNGKAEQPDILQNAEEAGNGILKHIENWFEMEE